METAKKLITENLDIWTSTVKAKSSAGRGANNKRELYGIQKLRDLILKLAVDGLLVDQDPDDEPATDQLKRISLAESKNGRKKKKSKSLTDSALSEIDSRQLPAGWANTTLESLFTVLNGRAYRKAELLESGTPVLRVGNLFTSSHWYYSDLELEDDKFCEGGDLIYAWSASFGPFIWDGPKAIYHYHIWKLLPHREEEISKEFLYWFLQEKTQEIKNAGRGLAMLHMTKGRMEKLAVRLPPLAEQHRIVAKVDELMALCDQLEQEQESSLDTHDTLVATLLGALTTATADASQFAEAWHRIQTNFDTLFTTESSIDQLKQTILQLAVMGKLVPQDSEDEPASKLLKEIAKEKAKLLKEGKIKKQKALEPISEEPFQSPLGWEWAQMGTLATQITDGVHHTPKYLDKGVPFISVKDIDGRTVSFQSCKYISREQHEEINQRCNPELGDVLICRIGTLGRVTIVDTNQPFSLFVSVGLIKFVQSCYEPRFAHLVLHSPLLLNQYQEIKAGGSHTNKLNLGDLPKLLLPIPPLAEQHRIVTKVDELMTLCDQLKASLATAQATQLNLANSLVEQAIG